MKAGLNVVLLGKTGAGKSATGNTILGQEAFKSEKCATSVTKDVVEKSGTVCGFPVTVYDTPGLCDPEQEESEIQQKYQSILQKCESGPCVFLLVIKADRFTKEERETVEKIEKMLGEKRLEKTCILFTRGDELEDEKKSIKQFINETEPLKNLVQKYEQRYHVFNNKKKSHTGQVQMLITKILKTCLHTMVHGATKQKRTDVTIHPSSRRIVLLGKSGVGKSATGNTILGQKEFKSQRKMKSVTSECSEKRATVSGRSVSVVDTPGFFDTQMNLEELMTEIAKSVYISSPGPHAFLIVIRVDERFLEQDQQIPQMIEMLFGQEVLKYSIILFTHGDLLEGQTVEKLIEESQALRDLVDQCGGRFHIFNNKAQNNREQVNDLLQKIDSMIEQNGGGHYSNEMFEDALRFREEEEEERKQQVEKQIQEMERVRKEEEERGRAEMGAEYERKSEEERREQKERRKEELERKRKEAEKRIRAENEVKLNSKKASNNTPAGASDALKRFLHKYQNWFYIGIGVGVVIGAITGVVVVGATAKAIACGAACGAVGGAVGGVLVAGVAACFAELFGGDAGSLLTEVDSNRRLLLHYI